jgi:hypothetical protein
MQDADHTSLCTQVFWVVPKRIERAPRRCKQAVVNSLWLMHGQLVKLRWQCKHHMEIRHRKQVLLPGRYPLLALVALTLYPVGLFLYLIYGVFRLCFTQ